MKILATARSAIKRLYRRIRTILYERRTKRGKAAGTFRYRFTDDDRHGQLPLTVWIRVNGSKGTTSDSGQAWRNRQSMAEVLVLGIDSMGDESWRIAPDGFDLTPDSPSWFAAPGSLPDVLPTHLESCFLVAAAEDVDAVVLLEGARQGSDILNPEANAAHKAPFRSVAFYRSDAYEWDPESDEIRPLKEQRLVKLIDPRDTDSDKPATDFFNIRRRGPYLSTTDLDEILRIPVRDAALVKRLTVTSDRPAVLVTAPFLARGGAEQTLFATMRHLADRFDFSIVTLAPHREALGDRRDDFRSITERLYCLGDLVHPDVMFGIIESILDATGAEIIYNANGTTLFYDFAPRLKAKRPGLRIVDHLYDHEVGYIDRYDRELLSAVDECVAENHLIAHTLTTLRGWPVDRVPVIWPCGRSENELPSPENRDSIRASLRGELGLSTNDVMFLTAARMHPQKRPLDLVRLAERVKDLENVHFVIVGGGDLEERIDEEISAQPDLNICRLPFRNDIPELILAADVGCLVSDFEGLPVFMLECLQLGRPFLGTRVGDLGRVLDETGAGVVVDVPGDLEALETAIRRLADTSFRSDIASKALQAGPAFSVGRCAEAYAAVFLGNA